VHDHIRSQFPKAEIFLFDHTTATTHTKAKKIVEGFYATKRSILIGTNMTLPYLTEPVDVSSVVSYEAAKAIPTWRADERLFSLLITLRELTTKDVIVQIRNEADDLLELARRGLLDQFYDGEIQLRNALKYPPYSIFILLSWLGNKEEVMEIQSGIEKSLAGTEIHFYSAPQSSADKMLRHGLIRVPSQTWPDTKILEGLRSLPPYIKIEMDPDRIV
jgi:primosomal protein N' (replication factor Y)